MRYKLSDICEYAKGKIKVSVLDENTYISTENMLPNKCGITKATSLPTQEQTQAFMKNDVLVSNIRPYFKKIWYATCDGGCSNDVLVFRAKDGVSCRFLYYVLADDTFFDYSMATSKGTKMPRGDKKAIMEYEVPDLSYEDQCKIASILEAIDEKICLNTAINKNLLEQAQAIYTKRFITDTDSLWPEGKLSDLIEVCYGKDHKKLHDGDIPVYGSGGIMRHVDRALYEQESVLVPRKGTLNNVMYVDEPFWSVDTMFFTKMKRQNVAKFVFHFLKGKDLASMNAGSAVPSMTTKILNAIPLQIPDDQTLSTFEAQVSPFYQAASYNNKESENLAAIRDSLLPKLMSGEIDVSDIDI